MEWQDYTVTAIAIAVGAVAVRWLWRLVCGRSRGGCVACSSTQCPLRKIKNGQ